MVQSELTMLIQGAQAGDRQAQEELLTGIQNRVYYHCKKMLKSDSDAQDATQDVLITVLTSLDKLREPAAFYGWVNGITANRCKHLLTQGRREWQIPETEDGDSMLDNLEDLDQQAVPDAVLDNKETQKLMMELIDALPPEQRMSVLFYYYDEMSVKEIAQAMETTEGTVKSRLNYARKSIKAGVEDLERRGTKLYSIAPLPLLLVLFLRKDAVQSGMTAAQSAQITSTVLSAAQTGKAGAVGAGAAAKAGAAGGTAVKTGTAVGVKVVAAVLSAAVAVGAAVGGILYLVNREEKPEDEEDPPAQVEQLPEEDPEPKDEGPSPELLALLDSVVYYGDKEQCKLTPEQAAAFAAVLRQEMANLQAKTENNEEDLVADFCVALFDTGSGIPAMFCGGGMNYTSGWASPDLDGDIGMYGDAYQSGIWEIRDGQATLFAEEGQEPAYFRRGPVSLREGSLLLGGWSEDHTEYNGKVYPLTESGIARMPLTFAAYAYNFEEPDNNSYTVDGAEVTQEDFDAWMVRWGDQPNLCGYYTGGASCSLTGVGNAQTAADALEQYAVNAQDSEKDDLILDVFAPDAQAPEADVSGAQSPENSGPISGIFGAQVQDYGPSYVQKVQELLAADPNLTFDLVYIDGDNIPELLVNHIDTDMDWNYISLYTFSGDNLYILKEDLLVDIRDYLGYYPRENLVESSCADLNMNQWESSVGYYQISGVHQLEQIPAPEKTLSEIQYLRGILTGTEILAQLEQ